MILNGNLQEHIAHCESTAVRDMMKSIANDIDKDILGTIKINEKG
jgi:hypothetical protein